MSNRNEKIKYINKLNAHHFLDSQETSAKYNSVGWGGDWQHEREASSKSER